MLRGSWVSLEVGTAMVDSLVICGRTEHPLKNRGGRKHVCTIKYYFLCWNETESFT